jgi:hypothetical protein
VLGIDFPPFASGLQCHTSTPEATETKEQDMTEKTITKADLRQLTGSERWYRHSLVRQVLYTEGAQYVAEHAGAY